MPDAPVVCPFCNSRIAAIADKSRPVCPRCDAALPAECAANLGVAASAPEPLFAPGKKKTLIAILSLMAGMAALAAIFALWTQSFRRSNDQKKSFVYANAASTLPDEGPALAYIPARCTILAAVNLADLRVNPIAKPALLDKMPRSVAWAAEKLTDSTGLTLNDLDHAATGIEIVNGAPKIYVIVQTAKDYNRDAIFKAFAPRTPKTLRSRPYIQFPLSHLGSGTAWCLTDRHIAFLFTLEPATPADLEAIPERPRPKLEGSPDAVKKLVKERIDKQSLAWLAGDLGQLGTLADVLGALGARTEPYRPLLDAKGVAISIKTDRDVVMLAEVLPASAKDAVKVEDWARQTDWRGATLKIETAPPESSPEPWVTLQLRATPEAVDRLLSQGSGVKRE